MTAEPPLSALGEFRWLKKLLPRLFWPRSLYPQLCIGPGDDAGVLRLSSRRVLVATTDAMVEGIHFERRWFSWRNVGEKLMAVNLSDLAAMGKVKPLAVLITAALPGDTPVNSVDNFYQGLNSCAQRWKTGFLGGDTVGSKKDCFVSATLIGEADPRELIQRRGARPGDWIVVTGPLGLAGAGLEVLQTGKSQWRWTAPLVKAFAQPQPRFKAGAILGSQQLATSMMDISDGLEASVKLLAEASNLGAALFSEEFRIHPSLKRWAAHRRRAPWTYVLQGGEDYELIFTVAPSRWPLVKKGLPQAYRVGRMQPVRAGLWAQIGSQKIPLKQYGYTHFQNKAR